MVSVVQSPYTNQQIAAWLRGLLTVAWADGNYDPQEQELIAQMTKEMAISGDQVPFKSITPEELAEQLGKEEKTAENFLRTAVLVAIADGTYSKSEAELLHRFSDACHLKVEALQSLEHTLCETPQKSIAQESEAASRTELVSPPHPHPDLLQPVKHWLDDMEIHDPRLARFICKMVPTQCPFERDLTLFGHKIVHIPPMCKLNPLYDQLVSLRFRSLSYLADECHEDISEYI